MNFDVELCNNKIYDYEEILSRYSQWKLYYRDIKLQMLLNEDVKLEFKIEDIDNMYIPISESNIISLKDVCLYVTNITFIIKDYDVIKLTIGCNKLDTYYGLIVQDLVNNKIDLKISQNKPSDNNNKVLGFFINIE